MEALWNGGKDKTFQGYYIGTIGERSKKKHKRRKSDTSYTIVFDDGTIQSTVLEEHVRPTRPLSGLYKTSCVDASSNSDDSDATRLRFELNFLSTGEIQGIGHRCEQQESMDDEMVNGHWWRDVMKCRVRVDFSWSDMTFRGYMDGLGKSTGSWYDKGNEDCVRGEWSMVSCGSLPNKASLPESWVGYVFAESKDEEFVIVEFIKSASLIRYATLSPQQNMTNAFECTIGVFREALKTNRLEFVRKAKESERKNALCLARSIIPSLQGSRVETEKKKRKEEKKEEEFITFKDKDGSSIKFKVNAKYKNLEEYVFSFICFVSCDIIRTLRTIQQQIRGR